MNPPCTRGLEKRIRNHHDGMEQRRIMKSAVQKILAKQGFVSPESLADFCTTSSMKCINVACSVALKDAKEASDYLQQSESEEFEEIAF